MEHLMWFVMSGFLILLQKYRCRWFHLKDVFNFETLCSHIGSPLKYCLCLNIKKNDPSREKGSFPLLEILQGFPFCRVPCQLLYFKQQACFWENTVGRESLHYTKVAEYSNSIRPWLPYTSAISQGSIYSEKAGGMT